MKKLITLGIALAMLVTMILPVTAMAADTSVISADVAVPGVTVTAPSGIDVGTMTSAPGTDQQYVGNATDGNIAVSNLGGKTFTVTVTGSGTDLSGTGLTNLANALQIATGSGSYQLGNVTNAAALTSGSWSDPGSDVVAVTGSSQQIGTGISSTPFAIKLTAFQKINATEVLKSGEYTLTLTYAATVTE
jgi:hypothetical protein